MAVVSWPASNSVTSSSRTSWSDSRCPSSSWAKSSAENTSSRDSRSSSERRRAISANSTSSTSRRAVSNWRVEFERLPSRPSSVISTSPRERATGATMLRRRRRSSVSSAPGSYPNTVRMITPRVSDCMLGNNSNGWPTGQESISASVALRMTSTYSCILWPWNAGSISRR